MKRVHQTEAEARTAIEVDRSHGYRAHSNEWRPPVWDLRTPDGWCWEQGRHLNACHSKKEADYSLKNDPIEACEPGCPGCDEYDEEEGAR